MVRRWCNTPFLIALALSAFRWAWTGLKFRSFGIVPMDFVETGVGSVRRRREMAARKLALFRRQTWFGL